ncbi:MAG: CsbD family protein [Clostridium sp.]|uniref:CsbD family protein n=1 Tax=Clostridium sp. TaxID=1506 RepID=UPI003D6D0CD5
MPNLNNKVENVKDKVVGKIKETAGKVSDNQTMEIKGKLQYQKGNLKEKIDKTKDKIVDKFNDTLNKK